MASTSRHYVHFIGAGTLTVALTDPSEAEIVTLAQFPVTWTYAGGTTQRAYRVVIYSDAAATNIVYDSNWIVSSTASHTVPSGAIPNGGTFYLRATVQDINGAEGSSAVQSFSTSYVTSSNVLNVRAAAIGCEDPQSLPLVRVTWSQIVPAGGESFVQYMVQRRAAGETTWTRLSTLTTIGTTSYIDYTAQPGVTYYYSVVWIASSGVNYLLSNAQANVTAHLAFDWAWLHVLDDPTKAVRLDALEMSENLVQSISLQETWGRHAPSALIGEANYSTFSIPLSTQVLRTPTQWNMLRTILDYQRDSGSILCLRLGRSQQRFFCTLMNPSRNYTLVSSDASIELSEVYYEEAA